MTSLREAYDAETFRSQGHRVIDQLADYLARATGAAGGAPLQVLPWVPPDDMLTRWPARFDAPESLDALVARLLAASNHLHHPRYVGHQVAVALPVAALCDLVAATLNNGMAVYETGPVSTAMERNVARWFGRELGFEGAADAVFTSGGSAGNLTALLAARSVKAGFDVWEEGAHAGPPLAVLASEQTHYCVKRAAQIMGWGAGGVIPVPVDARFRLRADALADARRAAERAGRKVIAVVASAGSTATGAFDPLDAVADFCEAEGLWMHVDGAHGAAAALSDKYRPLTRGLARADSVVVDAHKMMMMPSLLTAVVFRDGARSYEAFAQQASYLFAGAARREDEWFNSAARTLECTKTMMIVKLYATLALHGRGLVSDYVTRMFDLGARFAARLRVAPDFEVPTDPDCNIVCFRHMPAARRTEGAPDADASSELDVHQARIRRRVVEDGSFYLVQTRLPTGLYLRVTLMNPLTTDEDLGALIEAVRAAAVGGPLPGHDTP